MAYDWIEKKIFRKIPSKNQKIVKIEANFLLTSFYLLRLIIKKKQKVWGK